MLTWEETYRTKSCLRPSKHRWDRAILVLIFYTFKLKLCNILKQQWGSRGSPALARLQLPSSLTVAMADGSFSPGTQVSQPCSNERTYKVLPSTFHNQESPTFFSSQVGEQHCLHQAFSTWWPLDGLDQLPSVDGTRDRKQVEVATLGKAGLNITFDTQQGHLILTTIRLHPMLRQNR